MNTRFVGTGLKGVSFSKGASITTLTKGKYYKHIATVIYVNADNHIDIKYR